jgi:4-hydroxy-tetrahydrodipicolinate reductase
MITHKLIRMTMEIRISILGRGRMGQEIQRCISNSDDLVLAGIWARAGDTDESPISALQSDNLSSVLSSAQVAIDFTLPEVTEDVVRAATRTKTPLVCGVSGLAEPVRQIMTNAAEEIPILYDRNMSIGVAVMQQLVQLAGAALGHQFEAEIHETHHMHKLDAPSGTALQLGEALAASRGQAFAEACHYDPCGNTKPAKGQIHFDVSRRGEVPGEHTVLFKSANESLSLMHKVDDRRVFAVGAIRAARWLVNQPPGLYCMQDFILANKSTA